MTVEDTRAEHGPAEHEHRPGCGHETVQHDDHVDYVHDGPKHALHGDHYDEH
ncbi:zinc transporter permease [Arthrobacter sp. PAMC25564]|nr:zinc transporter permease [Arthrobacter sp. PAMC25564]